MPTRQTTFWWHGLGFLAASAVALLLEAQQPAKAFTIPYSFNGVEFSTAQNNPAGTITGSFTLDCSEAVDAQDCVTYQQGETEWKRDTSTLSFNFYYQDLINISSLAYTFPSQDISGGFSSALYGYTDDGVYFIFLVGSATQGNKDADFILFLDDPNTGFFDPLPTEPGQAIPLTQSAGNNVSTVCVNTLPPTAKNRCPPNDNQSIPITGFTGRVVNLVPSPFGASILMLPALALLRLRNRYR